MEHSGGANKKADILMAFSNALFPNQQIHIFVPADIVETTIFVPSRTYQFNATCSLKQKCHCCDQILSFWTLAVHPVTEISWNDYCVADFESCVPSTRYSNGLYWLVWMIRCQDSSSSNGQQGACPLACLWAVQQLNIFRNMFRKPDISSWDTMPDSWSSDNWIKKIAADVD